MARELCGQCSRPLVTRPGDLGPTCAECRSIPGACDCDPLPPIDGVTSVTSVTSTDRYAESSYIGTEGESNKVTDVTRLLEGVRNGAWLDAQTFPPMRWAIPGLVPEGLTLLVGAPKIGKSWLALAWLLAVAYGGAALGSIKCEEPRPAFNLALEDGDRRMQDRCREILGSAPIPAEYSYLTKLKKDDLFPLTAAWLEAVPDTGMFVIDTLGKIMPDARNGETTYSRDYRIGSRLKAAADYRTGLALVVLHHDRKAASADFVESVSGTNGLAGAADAVMVLRRDRHSAEGLLQVTGRDIPENEYAIKLDNGTWLLDGDDLEGAAKTAARRREGENLGDTSRKILDFAAQHPEGIRAKEVADKFGDQARVYLGRLTESGHLDKPGRGLYIIPGGKP